MGRKGVVTRETGETKIWLELELDGQGSLTGKTGVGFFDHMLHLWVRHSGFDLNLEVAGDLDVDAHHTVEDVGICLGKAFTQAIGDKRGIRRYGSAWLPMDEALILAVVDISGRPYLGMQVSLPSKQVGSFDTELVKEFWRAFVLHGGITLHLKQEAGSNTHHIIEALFKGCGRAMREAVALDPREQGIPSTKGLL